MSQQISLFSGYNQKENRVTNYCLLALKMVYDESPKYIAAVLSEFIGEEIQNSIGVKFLQQTRAKSSIPDGSLIQEPVIIHLETKLHDYFDIPQLKNHVEALKVRHGIKALIALGTIENSYESESLLKELNCPKDIIFSRIDFSTFLNAFDIDDLPINIKQIISELREYLLDQGLLATWQDLLDVTNCAQYSHIQIEDGVYMCPDKSGAYTHSRCKYFGVYHEKEVSHVAEIKALIRVNSSKECKVERKIDDRISDSELTKTALIMIDKHGWKLPAQVFLLGERYKTNFIKDSKGGLFASKKYFNIASLNVQNAEELAFKLNGIVWSNL